MMMSQHSRASALLGALLAVASVACSDSELAESPPPSYEAEAARIDRALTANPSDPAANRWADAFNARSDEQLGLLETVEVGDGHSIQFYRTDDGANFIIEKARIGAGRVLAGAGAAAGSMSALYQYLRPAAEVPSTLREADLASTPPVAIAPASNDQALDPREPGASALHDGDDKSISCTEFKASCREGDAGVCNCNNSADFTGNWTKTYNSLHHVAAFAGTVNFEFTHNNKRIVSYVVREGEIYYARYYTGHVYGGLSCDGTCLVETCNWSLNNGRVCWCEEGVCRGAHGIRVYNVGPDDRWHRHDCIDRSPKNWNCV